MYTKVLLKVSGEFLATADEAIALEQVTAVADEIASLTNQGVKVACVIGAGNIIRGGRKTSNTGWNQLLPDYAGMMATVVNGVMLQAALSQKNIPTRLESTIDVPHLAAQDGPLARAEAFENGVVVIFTGGTGQPFVTTDTAAVLYAAQLGIEVVLKATKVDGVYSADPEVDPSAERFAELTYTDVLARQLKVMDAAAIALAQERGIEIQVFQWAAGSVAQVVAGEAIGTRIYAD